VRCRRLARGPLLASASLALAAAVAWAATGCAGYINYPPVGDDWAINHTNVNPSLAIMEAGMLRALRRSGAPGGLQHGEYVVNPPRGTEMRYAQALVDRLNAQPGFEGAQIVTPENGHLPCYHVTRVWVRGDEAIIDILRPIQSIRPAEGQQEVHQPYTVWLRGGAFEHWRTVSTRDWPVGLDPVPMRWNWATQFAAPEPMPQQPLNDPGSLDGTYDAAPSDAPAVDLPEEGR
jgi:hypothetical protein